MHKYVFYLLASLLILGALQAGAQEEYPYEPAFYVGQSGDTLPYRILYPLNFDPEEEYPLLFVLHGAGERGKDNSSQLIHGSKLFLQEDIRRDYPAIVVFPQCPQEDFWSNVVIDRDARPLKFEFQTDGKPTKAMKLLEELVDEIAEQKYINKKQIYVGGLSMGGMGTLELLRRDPKRFAAAFAICGGDNLENAKKYKGVPLWLFHGAKDDVVPVRFSETLAEKLESLEAKSIKLTLYPEANHNSWDKAFAEPEFMSWLFSKRKK